MASPFHAPGFLLPTQVVGPASVHSPAAVKASGTGSRVNILVRMALYVFVLSIPFEMPHRSIPLEIPTLTGAVFLLSTVFNPTACFRRIPGAFVWFVVYLWIFAVAVYLDAVEHRVLVLRFFINMAQLVLIFWVLYNLLSDERVLRGVLVSLVLACAVRAAIQVLGIGATSHVLWTGGVRVTALGQNANLSAIILSAGLTLVVGMQLSGERRLPRAGLLAWPIAALLGFAIVQTGSRGGMLCALLGLAVFAFRGRTVPLRIRNGLFATTAVALLVMAAFRSEGMRGRLGWAAEGNLAGRELIYPALVDMFMERPLLGWGPIDNQFEVAKRIDERERARRDAHNLLLELLTATGVAGAIPFVAGLTLCLRGAWRARRGLLGILPLAVFAAVMTGTVSGTWIAAKIVWLTLALALAAGSHWASPRRPQPD